MTDEEILKMMGLKNEELSDLCQKFNNFFNGLAPAQRKMFHTALRTKEESRKELGAGVTPDQLEQFMRKHCPPGGTIFFGCEVHPPAPLPKEE